MKVKEILDKIPGNGYKTIAGIGLIGIAVFLHLAGVMTLEQADALAMTGATAAFVGLIHKIMKEDV